jgi:hypothetical protein
MTMFNTTRSNTILSTFALGMLIAGTGCAVDADDTMDRVRAGHQTDMVDQEADLTIGSARAQGSAEQGVRFEESDESKGGLDLSEAEPGQDPVGEDAPLILSFVYLNNVVHTLQWVAPTQADRVHTDSFVSFDMAGTLNFATQADDPTGPLYRYDASTGLLEFSYIGSDGEHRGTMSCSASERQGGETRARSFDCNFTVDNGQAEHSGSISLTHDLADDTMRIVVASQDLRDEGTTSIRASYLLEDAMDPCRTINSHHRVSTPAGSSFIATMTDVLQCTAACEPEAGTVNFWVGSDQYTLSGASGEPWQKVDASGTSVVLNSCK